MSADLLQSPCLLIPASELFCLGGNLQLDMARCTNMYIIFVICCHRRRILWRVHAHPTGLHASLDLRAADNPDGRAALRGSAAHDMYISTELGRQRDVSAVCPRADVQSEVVRRGACETDLPCASASALPVARCEGEDAAYHLYGHGAGVAGQADVRSAARHRSGIAWRTGF